LCQVFLAIDQAGFHLLPRRDNVTNQAAVGVMVEEAAIGIVGP
jgi:hypothetical protein